MKYVVLILAMSLSFSFIAKCEKKSYLKGDFDGDSKEDLISIEEISSSSSVSFHITCKFSTLTHDVSYNSEYDFSKFIFVCGIPNAVSNRKLFCKKLAGVLVENSKDIGYSDEFKWLYSVRANSNYKVDSFVNYRSKFDFNWSRTLPNLTNAVYFVADKKHAAAFRNMDDKNDNYVLIFYMANNHKRINKSIADSTYEMLITNHGVILKKNNRYAWVFINDIDIFKIGNEKLRWPSIKEVQVLKSSLIIKTVEIPGETESVFIIGLTSGSIKRLKDDYRDRAVDMVEESRQIN